MTTKEKPGIEGEIKGQAPLTLFFEDARAREVARTGGKGASLAELQSIPGIKVPEGFVATTSLYDEVIAQSPELRAQITDLDRTSEMWLRAKMTGKDEDAGELGNQVNEKGEALRKMFKDIPLSSELRESILKSYHDLSQKMGVEDLEVAVRSSCTLEDRADFSFAGQYKTELHKKGDDQVLDATMTCLASQFGGVVKYRNDARLAISGEILQVNGGNIEDALDASKNLSHTESKLAVVIQRMINASESVSGIAFSNNSNTGADEICIDVTWGLGERNVSGEVIPDKYVVDAKTFEIIGRKRGEKATKTVYVNGGTGTVDVSEEERRKFCTTDAKVIETAKAVSIIKDRYGNPRDTELVFDENNELYFVQSRPDAALIKKLEGKDPAVVEIRELAIPESAAENAKVVLRAGTTGCPGVAVGEILIVETPDQAKAFLEQKENKGKKVILVTKMTTPDWGPIMGDFAGIITDKGGDNCHAAIVGREKGIPTLIGTGDATKKLISGQKVSLDVSAHKIYEGILPTVEIGDDADTRDIMSNPTDTVVKLNLSMPEEAGKLHAFSELKGDFGIGLFRIEFLLGEIGAHVNSLVDFDNGKIDKYSELYKQIDEIVAGYGSAENYYKTTLKEGISRAACKFPNSDITVRMTDFKTNEYANLVGGKEYEKVIENNPMMGNRGVIRAMSPVCREGTEWEFEAIKEARETHKNVQLMFPMVRTPDELTGSDRVHSLEGWKGMFEIMEETGLKRGEDGLKVGMMIEVPSNVRNIEKFLDTGVDFVSFGSNDLTQFTLAIDRDSEELRKIPWYNEEDPSVIDSIGDVITACKKRGVKTGICGNGASTRPNLVRMLVEKGIDSVSVTKDRYMATRRLVLEEEAKKRSLKKEGTIFGPHEEFSQSQFAS